MRIFYFLKTNETTGLQACNKRDLTIEKKSPQKDLTIALTERLSTLS